MENKIKEYLERVKQDLHNAIGFVHNELMLDDLNNFIAIEKSIESYLSEHFPKEEGKQPIKEEEIKSLPFQKRLELITPNLSLKQPIKQDGKQTLEERVSELEKKFNSLNK